MIPKHVGFIVDGNRRWARSNGKSMLEGHRQGALRAREIALYCIKEGITVASFYGFSTENWKRSDAEVAVLMKLFEWLADQFFADLIKLGIKVRHLGKLDGLPNSLQRAILRVTEASKHNTKLILNIAINYGGHDEIVRAAQKLMRGGSQPDEVTEASFEKLLDTADLPPVDLVIRTGGRHRSSNFLPWQTAYAELYFTGLLWPDFSPAEFDKALAWFAEQKRNFGA